MGVPGRAPTPTSSSEDGDILDLADDEGWEDLEADEESVKVRCLVCAVTFDAIPSVVQHSRTDHGLDLVDIQRNLGGRIHPRLSLVLTHTDRDPW